jgi:hypothetical protein
MLVIHDFQHWVDGSNEFIDEKKAYDCSDLRM